MFNYLYLKRIAEVEFPDIIETAEIIGQRKLRIIIKDSSYIDIFYSPYPSNRHFAFHWERTFIDGTIYRHDNIPDVNWKNVPTFPKHFHDGDYTSIKKSNLSDNPSDALREFLSFVRSKLVEPK